jgi:type I restriction enzyme, S subunit
MKWSESSLGELVAQDGGIIQTGPFGSQLHQADYEANGIPVIMPKDIIDGRVALDGVARVSEETAQRLGRHRLKERALVLPRRGEITKRAFITIEQAGWLCGTGCLKIELNGEYLLPEFLYYYMEQTHVVRWLEQHAVGTTMLNLNTEIAAGLPVRYPTLTIQQRIADILSAYDDLIENNRRRMALLEEAAWQLYREWFVRLRFPGHEHTRITHGIPEGWERKALAELSEFIDYGYTASAEQEEVGPKFLRITDIAPNFIDWASVPYCQIEDERMAKFRLCEGDIVIARTGATVGYAKRLHKRPPDAVFASYLVRLRLKSEADSLIVGVFVESQDYKNYVQSRIGGAAQPNANAKVLAAAEILVPPPAFKEAFRNFVEPMVDQRELLQIQNQKLRATRDLLLPRLMSGEITV